MLTRILRSFLPFLFVLSSPALSLSQNPPPQSDAQAVALAQQSMAALTGGNSISDVTLIGTVSWTNGSNTETSSAVLMAKGTGESRFDMTLSAGPRSEIRNDSSNDIRGEVLLTDGSVLPWGIGNCWVNAVWFFPQLSTLGVNGDPSLILAYMVQETRNGVSVQHVQSYRYIVGATPEATALNQQLSTMDIYLDSSSLIPAAYVFNLHSEDGASPDLPVEVDFSDYRSVNGILVPFRIQRYVAGSLGLDFSVSSAQLNSGLPDSQFLIQ